MNKTWEKRRKRVFEIIEVGNDIDLLSRSYDFLNALCIIINLIVSILYTFDEIRNVCGPFLIAIEEITVIGFGIDYFLRLWTAKYLHPSASEKKALKKYALSFTGIVDLLSFLPYYLPIFFPSGAAVFRMFRIVRIFRLFRVTAYYDSLNVITEVIAGKKTQLISSVFIIAVLMLASSLCMYSLEHEAQPEVFKNAFSGIWWSASTLLTVGYGDIYPITALGKALSIIITFLGVGMVAIPTGIISAGFVEQYSQIKQRSEYGHEEDIHFIKVHLLDHDSWVGKTLAELALPTGIIVAVIKRDGHILIPRGNITLRADDILVLGAEPYDETEHIKLKEIVLEENNPWIGQRIRDLDISRHSIIVLIKRNGKVLIPNGNIVLQDDDILFMYTHLHFNKANVHHI